MLFHSHGGVHPNDKKAPANETWISAIPQPPVVVIPLSQHIGAPCAPLVAVGDEVKLGQKIGEAAAPVSAPVHASVSGKVTAIEPRLNNLGNMVPSVIIENDFKDTPADTLVPAPESALDDPEALASIIREAGIVGMGGATFPTAFKITSGWGKVDTVIINGAECEPYITSDHRTMLEHPTELLKGIQLIMRACKVDKAYFGIETNKQFAIDLLNFNKAREMGIEIVPLRCQYPQGAEKTLIQTITGREVPPGGLPAQVGCAVFNTFTSYSVYRAVYEGWPAIERVVTVSGSAIAEPKNVKVRVGTPMEWVFEQTGGFKKEPWKIIMGGPMMGLAQYDLQVPCGKGTASLLAFAEDEDRTIAEPTCIRCGQCISACPMNLQPIYMYMYEEKGDVAMLDKLHITDCVECGACTYICPGRLHLTHAFKTGKAKLQAYNAAQKAREEAEKAKAAEAPAEDAEDPKAKKSKQKADPQAKAEAKAAAREAKARAKEAKAQEKEAKAAEKSASVPVGEKIKTAFQSCVEKVRSLFSKDNKKTSKSKAKSKTNAKAKAKNGSKAKNGGKAKSGKKEAK